MSTYALLAHTQNNGVPGGPLSSATADNMFAKATLNAVQSDSSTMVALASNQFTFSSTGNYQVNAVVGFGYASSFAGVSFRAGLYNVTSSAFVPNAGGAVEIIGESGVAPTVSGGPAAGTLYVNLRGRFNVSSTADAYAIYCAGDSASAVWFSSTNAQGAPAALVTTGSKNEIYKLVELIKE